MTSQVDFSQSLSHSSPFPRRLSSLDALRGIFALLLVVFHVRGIPQLTISPSFNRIIDLFGTGVPLFYAVSAFSLFLGYENVLEQQKGLQSFYLKRFLRIAPLFYFMLIFWLLIRNFHFHNTVSAREILINVTFLFGLYPGRHEGIVWASWAIGILCIFYALFPIFVLLARNVKSAFAFFIVSLLISINTRTLLSGISDYSPSFLYMNFLNHLVFFCAGLLAYHISKVLVSRGFILNGLVFFRWFLIIITFAWLYVGWFSPIQRIVNEANLGVHWSSVAWIFLLVGAVVGLPLLDNPIFRFAGQVSYGLYLLNPPIIYGLQKAGVYGWFYQHLTSQQNAFISCCFVTFVIVGFSSWLTHLIIEKPGIRLGDRIFSRVLNRLQ